MALAAKLTEKEHEPARIETTAKVHLVKTDTGFAIPKIELETEAEVPGIGDAAFQELANDAKENCPVSRVLADAEITLVSKLLN
jgi:osmotically inducible protein OsmC